MSAETREAAKLKTRISTLEERVEELENILREVRKEANTHTPPTIYK